MVNVRCAELSPFALIYGLCPDNHSAGSEKTEVTTQSSPYPSSPSHRHSRTALHASPIPHHRPATAASISASATLPPTYSESPRVIPFTGPSRVPAPSHLRCLCPLLFPSASPTSQPSESQRPGAESLLHELNKVKTIITSTPTASPHSVSPPRPPQSAPALAARLN